ncbi:MAG: ATP-binding cassette domain-containing protein [Spirochaetota bacterium]
MIEMKSVTFAYGRKAPLFQQLDARLEPGTIYGLLGRNGAGKTTMLKLMCGLLFPQQGEIGVLGHDPAGRNPELQQEIILIPEEFATPTLTVHDYRSLYAPFYPRFNGEEFERHLGEFQLDGADKLSEMSYGQKKKVLLAFGLAAHTKLLILDEPTNGLDIPSKGQFRRLLVGSSDEKRVIVVSTHQVRDMENLIDPITILERGRVIFQHTLDEITSRIRMTHETEQPHDALYSESAMGGYAAVVPNHNGQESRIDLELLFNAVTTNPERVEALFAEEGVR